MSSISSVQDSDILNHFGFSEFKPNDCGYFRCGRGKVHYMTDLRKAYKANMSKAQLKKAASGELPANSEVDIDHTVEMLKEQFGDKAFKNKTQPNVHFDKTKFYVMCGRTDYYRLSIRSEQHTFDEMALLLEGRPLKINPSADRNTIAINSIKGFDNLVQTIRLCEVLFR